MLGLFQSTSRYLSRATRGSVNAYRGRKLRQDEFQVDVF